MLQVRLVRALVAVQVLQRVQSLAYRTAPVGSLAHLQGRQARASDRQ